jgi:predicted dehydrogenase
MKNKIYKILLVGLGNIAVGYDLQGAEGNIATHAKACMAHPCCELVGGVDPDLEKRERFTAFTGKPAYESLMRAAEISSHADAFIISTPSPVRIEPMMACLAHKPDFIILEKPVALHWNEALSIERRAKEEKIPIFVNYFRHYLPSVHAIFDTIHRNNFGRLMSGHLSYSRGLFNNASHMIALLLQHYGIPERIQTIGGKTESEPWGDVAIPFVLYFNHAPISFYASMTSYGSGDGVLYFEAGKVSFKHYFETVELWGIDRRPLSIDQPDCANYQYDALDQIIQCVEKGGETNFREALETLQVCLAVKDDGAFIEA